MKQFEHKCLIRYAANTPSDEERCTCYEDWKQKCLAEDQQQKKWTDEEWISVEDRLPEFDGEYLCSIMRNEECGNNWSRQDVVQNSFNKWILLNDGDILTHWMPLPNPPKTKDK